MAKQPAPARFVLESEAHADAAMRVIASGLDMHASDPFTRVDRYLDDREGRLWRDGWVCRVSTPLGPDTGTPIVVTLEAGPQVTEQTLFEPLELPIKRRRFPDGPVAERLVTLDVGRLQERFRLQVSATRYRALSAQGAEFEVVVEHAQGGMTALDRRQLTIETFGDGSHEAAQLVQERLWAKGFVSARLGIVELAAWEARLNRPPRTASVSPNDSAGQMITSQLRRWHVRAQHYGRVAAEGVDPRGVRLVRTNLRRMRATLKAVQPLFGGQAVTLHERLSEVSRGVGGRRDQDVLDTWVCVRLNGWRGVDTFDAQQLARRLRGAGGRMDEVASHALERLFADEEEIDDVIDALATLEWPRCEQFAKKVVRKRFKQMRRLGRELHDNSPDAAFHRLRLSAKRLRYALQLIRPAYGEQAKGYARMVQALQDAFGEHQDLCVIREHLTQHAQEMPADHSSRGALVLLGRLLQDAHEGADRAKQRALRIWSEFDRLVDARDLKRLLNAP